MKLKLAITAALALAVAGPALAHDYFHHHASDSDASYAARMSDDGNIHTGATNADDQALADRVADALRNDRKLSEPGITATITANNGHVSLSGFANNQQQGYRAEQDARRVAGAANVSGTLANEAG